MNTINEPAYQRMIARLVSARKDAGFTQAQAARVLGWRRTMLSQLETCQRRLDILEACSICRLYHVRMAELESIGGGKTQRQHRLPDPANDERFHPRP